MLLYLRVPSGDDSRADCLSPLRPQHSFDRFLDLVEVATDTVAVVDNSATVVDTIADPSVVELNRSTLAPPQNAFPPLG